MKWCEHCESFTEVTDAAGDCLDCAGPLVDAKESGHRPCHQCRVFEPMENADICVVCRDEQKSCWNYTDLLETYPDLCAECFLRVADDKTCMCAPCYAEVCWNAPLGAGTWQSNTMKEYYPSAGKFDDRGYSFWEPEPDLPIPDASEELESIPCMRAAA